MKPFLLLICVCIALSSVRCATKIPPEKPQDRKTVAQTPGDTIRIANDEIGYEIIIIDPGFNSWFAGNARPRGYYSQHYLEARNLVWVNEWNLRVGNQLQSRDLFGMRIDYSPGVDYGYEVNYLLYNYLVYFQIRNGVQLGSFVPRP